MTDEGGVRTRESVRELSSVAGETAVVTGASSGIGRAVAETFVADGAESVRARGRTWSPSPRN